MWGDDILGKVNVDALNKGAQRGGVTGKSVMLKIGEDVFVLGVLGNPIVWGGVGGMLITVFVFHEPSQLLCESGSKLGEVT